MDRPENHVQFTGAQPGLRLDEADLRRLEELVPRSGWSGDRQAFAVPVTVRDHLLTG